MSDDCTCGHARIQHASFRAGIPCLVASEGCSCTRFATRPSVIEDYASFWWAQETGETDQWADLGGDERQAVVENSYAEVVADWLERR